MIVLLGEIGGWEEYEICNVWGTSVRAQSSFFAQILQSKQVTKPLCAWVSGTVASIFSTEVQFGHAGISEILKVLVIYL